jgi:L-2-hydroxyglutarate oxidase
MMYDFAIIGGGIVGLAVGLFLGKKYPKSQIVLLEKESILGFHQTGHNSGVIHSGIYYKPGSFKAKFCREGNHSMRQFCEEHNIEHEICGKVIVATDEKELNQLENLYQRGRENGITVTKISAEEVREIEPYVSALAGVKVGETGIVNYRQVCQKYAELITNQGGKICLNKKVTKITESPNKCQIIETNDETFESRFIINCTGLYSDRVTKICGCDPGLKIIPFRGEYYELKPEKRYLVKNLIYPVPNPAFPFLGVHFTRMIDGSVHAGPNAVLSFKREGYKKTDFDWIDFTEVMTYPGFWKLAAKYASEGLQEMIRSWSKRAFVHSLQNLIPEVQENDIIASEAGVRAQALRYNGDLVDDFVIIPGHNNAVHVCNAPSPAATASLEIGKAVVEYVAKYYKS